MRSSKSFHHQCCIDGALADRSTLADDVILVESAFGPLAFYVFVNKAFISGLCYIVFGVSAVGVASGAEAQTLGLMVLWGPGPKINRSLEIK